MTIKADGLRSMVVRVELLHAVFVTMIGILLFPAKLIEPWALLIGALFMGVNFCLLSFGIRLVLKPFSSKGRIKTGIALLIAKMALFLGVISALLFRIRLDPLSFTLGFTSLLVAIVAERVWAAASVGE